MSYKRWNHTDNSFHSGSLSNLTSTGRYGDMSTSRNYAALRPPNKFVSPDNGVSRFASSRPIYDPSPIWSGASKKSYDNAYHRTYHPVITEPKKRENLHSSSPFLAQSSSTRLGYDSGIRSYSSSRALNDSNTYGSRYGSGYNSAAASNRYGGSSSAVDHYSSPSRSGNAWGSHSNLGRYGSGDVSGPAPYRSTRDYDSKSPSRSYSYASGLGGSGNSYPLSNVMTRSAYTPSYSRYTAKRPDDYGGSSGRLYGSLSDAHNNIVGRRQSLAGNPTISSTPPTPTESVAPPWREHSVDAVISDGKWPDNLSVDVAPGFTLAKPSMPSPIYEKSPPPSESHHLTPESATTNEDFNAFYDRYVTHSPISDVDRQNSAPNENPDSAYSSRIEENESKSETMSQSRTSDSGQQEEADEEEFEAEEVGTEVEEQKQDETDTEKEDDEKRNVSGKGCLDIEPPWQQFVSSFEEEEEEEEEEGKGVLRKDEDVPEEEESKEGEERKELPEKEYSMEPSQSMMNSMYENEEEEEEEEETEPPRRKRLSMSFAEAIRKRCEEMTGVVAEEEKSNQGSFYDPMTSSNCWQQFSFYEDEDADEAEGEEEANDQVPPWQQFIDYTVPAKPINKYHIQVQAIESESEYTSDEEERSHRSQENKHKIVKSPGFMRLLAPPKDSGAETSSEIESDYEPILAATQTKTFPFLPEEKIEERGRVESHLAQPPPVFSIKVTYDEEESVGTVSEYEDEEEEEKDRSVSPMRRSPLPQIMITSDNNDQLSVGVQSREASSVERDDISYESDNSVIGTIKVPKKKAADKLQSDKPDVSEEVIRETKEVTLKEEKKEEKKVDKKEDKKEEKEAKKGSSREGTPAKTEESSKETPKEKKEIPEIVLQTVKAKETVENIQSDHLERFYPKKEKEDWAMLRTVKGVQEYARTSTIPSLVAAAPQKVVPEKKSLAQESKLDKATAFITKIASDSDKKSDKITQEKKAEEKKPGSRRGSGIVEAMANKFKTDSQLIPDNRAAMEREKKIQEEKEKYRQQLLEAARTGRKIDSKRVAAKAVVEPQPAQQGPTFEEQMEELRKKMKAGTSQLSQQMKDISKGMVDATTNAKLAAEIATTKGLIDDAANLRQAVSKKYDQWKTTAQEEMEKRERELKEPLPMKPNLESMIKANQEMYDKPKTTTQESGKTEEKKEEAKQQPYTRKNTMREPGKVASPFADKVRIESELAKAAVEEQARREARMQLQKKKEEELKKEKEREQEAQCQRFKQTQEREKEMQKQKEVQLQKEKEKRIQQDREKLQKQQQQKMQEFNQKQMQQQQLQQVLMQPDAKKSTLTQPKLADQKLLGQKLAEKKSADQQLDQKSIGQKPADQKLDQKSIGQKPIDQKLPTQKPDQKFGQKSAPDKIDKVEPAKSKEGIDPKNKSDQNKTQVDSRKAQTGEKLGQEPKKDDRKIKKSVEKAKKWRRRRPNRFIGEVQDIDDILNNKKNRLTSFDQFELFYENCSKDVRKSQSTTSKAKCKLSKIFIFDTTDIDEIYDPIDLRSLMGMFSPTSKVPMTFDDSTVKAKMGKADDKHKKLGQPGKKVREHGLHAMEARRKKRNRPHGR